MANTENVINKGYKDVNPLLFGRQRCESSHHYGPAIRTYWLLHFVVKGKGYFKIRDREYTVPQGSVFVIPPFVETYYEADEKDPWEYLWVGFTSEGTPPFSGKDVVHLPGAERIFEEMDACKKMNAGKTEFLCAQIWRLFALMLETENKTPDCVEKAVNIIHAEFMTGLTVADVAARVGLDRSHFTSVFKAAVGLSPKEYLQKCRMEQALDHLLHGHSVSVTALSVGYGDVYVFSKMFKRYFGVAPSQKKSK